ncbi:MAG: sulfatase-like hydrolase/transferase [Planctomycetota bacterium]
MRKLLFVQVCAILLLWLPFGACERRDGGGSSHGAGRLSLLLITLDTTRADRIGCYGYTNARTPTFDGLARSGVLFKDALCQVPLTLPSHASMLTGTYPATNGVRVNGVALGKGVATLAEVFRDRGYRTAAFVSALVLDSGFGLGRGFDMYDDDLGAAEAIERPADKVSDAALRWLGAPPDKPFFAWVHYFDPHSPYQPPESFREGFASPYDGEIAFVDSQVARLLKWIDEKGLRDTTLIVVAGDHGEAFGEHDETEHGLFIYNTTMHVPLIFSFPRALPSGHVVTRPVELIDLFPTIAKFLDWEEREDLEGKSLMPAWQTAEIIDRPVYGESEYARLGFGWASLRSVTTDQWKYIEAPRSELYDRTKDPSESVNVIAEHPDIAAQMQTTLWNLTKPMKLRAESNSVRDPEMISRLRSLGYVSVGYSPPGTAGSNSGRDPKDMVGAYRAHSKAVDLQLQGRYAEVLAIMEPLVQQSPESDEFFNTLGIAYLELGRAADAEKAFAASLRIASDNPRRLWRMGEALQRQNKLDEAVTNLEAALAIAPDLAVAHCTLGDILGQRGKAAEAIKHYEAAVSASANLGKAHGRLGVSYAQQQKFAEAEKHLRRYVELEPTSPHALANLGNVLFELRRADEAAVLLQKALRYDPAYAPAHMTLFQALLAAGKPKEGIQALREARAALPNVGVLTLRLAWLLATIPRDDLRNPDEALKLARVLYESGPPTADNLTLLAAAQAASGDFDQAAASARNALSLARAQGDTAAVRRIEGQLRFYESGRPYRE